MQKIFKSFDIAIIGAGINGCTLAYELKNENQDVVLIDKESVASGGSGSAGAFISPKFSKSGDLKELIHKSFLYSLDFYEKNFKTILQKSRLVHIARDAKESEVLRIYKEKTDLKLYDVVEKYTEESISIDAGIVDAKEMCKALSRDVELIKHNVKSIRFEDDMWVIDDKYKAKKIVLAIGAYEDLLDEPYNGIRGVWGHRVDVKSSTINEKTLHQYVSISPSKDGVLAVGATHNVHYHPQKTDEAYDFEEGRAELLEKASRTINLENVEIIKDYVGLRSGSVDYMPLVGEVVDSEKTLASSGIRFDTKQNNFDKYIYYKNLYMINGNGGYGFVLAPYLAKMLKDYILYSKELDVKISPARFFARWARRKR